MECSLTPLDPALFAQVWRRVMPCDRPDCPFTLAPVSSENASGRKPELTPCPRRQPHALCLSPHSTADLPRLELILLSAADAQRTCQTMARRLGSRLLAQLAGEKQHQLNKLAAAHYLITGRPFPLDPTPAPQPLPLAPSLRERFHAEQRQAAVLLTAAHKAGDPCLADLYRSLAAESRLAALRLWDALAQIQH